ncbi:MAG: enoyl-CoA hydratase-related protein [Blastocatellia bacterium]|nr:enoyl-CoA hydratase-related protein [Blastocatellia bacterium]MCS7156888.1 enoyl-CoA hydratase-related protein [Blastocatellia bacterium]MDW8167580.1 enoyl-CoA hydratase-related protein [Acidobacteriota bacterium]MDW8256180.1 enoyl-CoA hydratase-related protein [Acidobacteriota bacterium]
MFEPTVLVERAGSVLKLTLNRPPLNILNIPMLQELNRALEQVNAGVRLVLLQSGIERAFSAGADVSDHVPERVEQMLAELHRAIVRLLELEALSIAVVRGHCLGGGMELAISCDFVLAGEGARFGQPEIQLGCFPPVAAVLLPQLIGPRRAAEVILTGRTFSARDAEAMGLITRAVPDEELATAVEALLDDLLRKSPIALTFAKRALRYGRSLDPRTALRAVERLYLDELMATEDAREGIRAFLEKREPVWTGR